MNAMLEGRNASGSDLGVHRSMLAWIDPSTLRDRFVTADAALTLLLLSFLELW